MLLKIPASIPDFLLDLLWFILEVILSAYLVEYLITRRETRRLQPIRNDFISIVTDRIDSDKTMVDFSYIIQHINLVMNSVALTHAKYSFENINSKLLRMQKIIESINQETPSAIDQAVKRTITLTDIDKNSLDLIIGLLDKIENHFKKIIDQIDASQNIFTIEMNAILTRIRQKLNANVDSVMSLRQFIKYPTSQSFQNRSSECIFSKDYCLNEIRELLILTKDNKKEIKWLDKKTNFSDAEQVQLIEKFYNAIPH